MKDDTTQVLMVDGQQVEYRLSGSGTPLIVLLNGYGMTLDSWQDLYPDIEELGTVLCYNRAGLGESDVAQVPQTGEVVINMLHALLKALELSSPFILVGHSLGGLYANLYTRTYPKNLLGVVLLESGHPDEAGEENEPSGLFKTILETFFNLFGIAFKDKPNSEHRSISDTLIQIKRSGDFPNVPLLVISGGKKLPFVPKVFFEKHQALQSELAKLSSNATHVWAEKSSHFPQVTEASLVLDILQEFVDTIKKKVT